MKTYQIGFFDEERRLERLQKLNDPLVDLARIVDFEMFRPKLSEAFARIQAERKSAAGLALSILDGNGLVPELGSLISPTTSVVIFILSGWDACGGTETWL